MAEGRVLGPGWIHETASLEWLVQLRESTECEERSGKAYLDSLPEVRSQRSHIRS